MKLNLLQKWELEHRKKILKEIRKARIEFTLENIDKIINETSFEVRSKKYSNECPYYVEKKPCHSTKDLNCFLCACPKYNSKIEEGGCEINSKFGKWYYHSNLPKEKVWDCSGCNYFHSPQSVKNFIKKNFKQLQEEFNHL